MSKVFIEETTLTAIGDAIRGKTGKTELIAPLSMATEISSITTGGGGGGDIEVDPIVLTNDCGYACAGKVSSIFIENNQNIISTNDMTGAGSMFLHSTLERIPFALNFKSTSKASLSNMFEFCENLKEIPHINNAYPSGIQKLFSYCNRIRYLPEDLGMNWNWNELHTYNYSHLSNIFEYCCSLRKIPAFFLSNLWGKQTSSSYFPCRSMFAYCYNLDEINNIPISQGPITSNGFSMAFYHCSRAKDITFATNGDGTPKIANWKNQTVELNNYVGYVSVWGNITSYYNSGITADKEVNNDATYEALKNNNDWFTTQLAYSRYNHDSAVNTINSLPDTSAYLATAGGTNTIKFIGASGSLTDGGAINTMTEEEIAVATAKGWTVVFT